VRSWSDRHMRPPPTVTVAGALVLALAALTVGVLEPGFVRDVDWQVHSWVEVNLQGEPAQAVSTVGTWLGQRGVVVGPLLAVALLAARAQRRARPVLLTLGVLAGVAVSVWLFKVGVGRVAPGAGRDAVHAGGSSYPSGHAVNSVVCWGLVLEFAASLGRPAAQLLTARRRRLITGVLAFTAGTGMTTLDYHWLSDTIAGWLFGALILGAVLAIGPVRSPAPAGLSPSVPPAPARPSPSG